MGGVGVLAGGARRHACAGGSKAVVVSRSGSAWHGSGGGSVGVRWRGLSVSPGVVGSGSHDEF
jgi:hypothetical protein